jgi:hypothetical protein
MPVQRTYTVDDGGRAIVGAGEVRGGRVAVVDSPAAIPGDESAIGVRPSETEDRRETGAVTLRRCEAADCAATIGRFQSPMRPS